MLILLPPSERKNVGVEESGFTLEGLSFAAQLTDTRKALIGKRDSDLFDALTGQAISIYSGVLYKSFDYESLSLASQERASDQILIFSALFGVLRPTDRIPAYSAKMKSSDRKKPLANALIEIENQFIIDCRSSTYEAAWKPTSVNTVYVRVFQVKNGHRSVITHMSKKYRGELARLLVDNEELKHPQELLTLASQRFEAELHAKTKKNPNYLDLIIGE